jgi:predicted amidohydrolase YtcJ
LDEGLQAIVGGTLIDGTGKTPVKKSIVVIRNSKVVEVGIEGEVNIPNEAEIIDATGKTVIPGFIDSHTHFILMGIKTLTTLDLSKTKSIDEVVEKVKEAAPRVPERAWLEGHGWDESGWDEKRYPTKRDLNPVSLDVPVVLTPYYGHIVSVNSAALKLAGINKNTPDPAGGQIVKDPDTGEPNGLLRDEAIKLIDKVKPPITEELSLQSLRKACEIALSWGCTSIHELGVDTIGLRTYQSARRDDSLKVRAYVMPTARFTEDLLDSLNVLGLTTGFGDEFYRIGSAKMYIDGSMGARTAVFSEPYNDDPSTKGIFTLSPRKLIERVSKAHRNGMQVAIHAIGDAGIDEALNAIEVAQKEHPRKDPRHRIEHCEILSDEQIERISRLGVVPSMQPNFVGEWGYPGGMYDQRLGPERLKKNNPYRKLLDSKIRVAFGSDCGYCPPWPINPLFGIWAAIRHPIEESSITLEEAVRCYTLDAAYASFEEDIKGSIETGKLADIAFLSQDLTEVEPEIIKDTEVWMTIVDGNIVWRNSSLMRA